MDEMDLASRALEAAPWRPEAYERARAMLRGAMAESGPPRRKRLRCLRWLRRGGILPGA